MAKRILVVDDDVDFLNQIAAQLTAQGFEVLAADGLTRARQIMAAARPDLAIVDLMLEHLDGGFVLCYHIKRTDATIPVILVTGVTHETGIDFDAATDEERRWVKADVMLDKPVRFERLRSEIDRLLPN